MPQSSGSLKKFMINGSIWTVGGYGAGQLIRFGRSLFLTRLLMPETFGEMALVWAVMYTLEMLSDIGVGATVIRDARGDDPDFLNTAWTLQVMRGAGLWLLACALAYPMSIYYSNPRLLQLIPITGLNALIGGFASTAVYTCNRHMEYAKVTILNVSNEVLSFVLILTWAYFYPSVWSLVGGALVGRVFLTLGTHYYLPGIKHAFKWDPSALTVLAKFGKWIFFSSALYILYMQGDRLMLGRVLTLSQLGVYSVALMLSEAVNSLTMKFSHSVLYPAFSKTVQNDIHALPNVVDKSRLSMDLILAIPIGVLFMVSEQLVHFIYDTRYAEAGWMLQILCVRLFMNAVLTSSEVCLFALGHPHYATFQNLARVIWVFAGIPIGWALMGLQGAVWAVALTELPVTFVLWIGLHRHKHFSLKREARSLLAGAVGILLGWLFLKILAQFA